MKNINQLEERIKELTRESAELLEKLNDLVTLRDDYPRHYLAMLMHQVQCGEDCMPGCHWNNEEEITFNGQRNTPAIWAAETHRKYLAEASQKLHKIECMALSNYSHIGVEKIVEIYLDCFEAEYLSKETT